MTWNWKVLRKQTSKVLITRKKICDSEVPDGSQTHWGVISQYAQVRIMMLYS